MLTDRRANKSHYPTTKRKPVLRGSSDNDIPTYRRIMSHVSERKSLYIVLFSIFLIYGCLRICRVDVWESPKIFSYDLLRTFKSDRTCFVQGVVSWSDDKVLQCCGGFGDSRIQLFDLNTGDGRVLWRPDDRGIFLEGCAWISDSELAVLTWKNKLIYKISITSVGSGVPTASVISTHFYAHQGWGLAAFENILVSSDGTATLRFFENLHEVRNCTVVVNSTPVWWLNALTVKGDSIYANIYMKMDPIGWPGWIIEIDKSCKVVSKIAIFGLHSTSLSEHALLNNVMNGLLWIKDELVVFGKNWEKAYAIKISNRSFYDNTNSFEKYSSRNISWGFH